MTNLKFIKYWTWFFRGSGAKPGYRRLLDKWIIFHLLVGFILSLIVQGSLQASANTVLLPLIGILIGLSFAWAGNAQALMQTSAIDEMANYHEGGFVEYVYVYQTAILMILTTLVFWALAGLSVFDAQWPTLMRTKPYFAVKVILFTLTSLTIRECWHVVLGAQWMLLVQREIKLSKKQRKDNKE